MRPAGRGVAWLLRGTGFLLWATLGAWATLAAFYTVPAPVWGRGLLAIGVVLVFIASIGERLYRRTAYGFSAGLTFHPSAILTGTNVTTKENLTGLERCRIIGQYTFGWGIGRYTNDGVGQGIDGQVDPLTGGLDLPYLSAFVVSYEHWFNERWMSAVTWSELHAASAENQPGTTYAGSKYFTCNLWYIPIRNLSLGAEFIRGERENVDGQRGRADRVNALVQYNF
jgi:hypothetical protein